MAEDPFCDFGGLPRSQCAHCRDAQRWQSQLRPLSPAEVQRWVFARYGGRDSGAQELLTQYRYLHDPEYHARVKMWEQMQRAAFGPSEDWEALAETAATGELGPWVTSLYQGVCRGCGGRWEDGDQIRFSEDEGGWICFSCGSAEP